MTERCELAPQSAPRSSEVRHPALTALCVLAYHEHVRRLVRTGARGRCRGGGQVSACGRLFSRWRWPRRSRSWAPRQRHGLPPHPRSRTIPRPYNISYTCGITTGPDGALWFTNFRANSIGRITPADMTTTPTPTFRSPTASPAAPTARCGSRTPATTRSGGSRPSEPSATTPTRIRYPTGITTGPDGALWFTNAATTRSGGSRPTARSPTSPAPHQARRIAAGPDGALWFTNTAQLDRPDHDRRGVTNYTDRPSRRRSASRRARRRVVVHEHRRATRSGASRPPACDHQLRRRQHLGPDGIAAGPDGALWFTNSRQQLDRPDHDGGVVTHFTDRASGPCGITPAPTARCGSRPTTRSGGSPRPVVRRSTRPSISAPFGITAGRTARCGSRTTATIRSVGSTRRHGHELHRHGHRASRRYRHGPDGALWFTNNGNCCRRHDSIGRITTPARSPATPTRHLGPDQHHGRPRRRAVVHQHQGNNSIGRITTDGGHQLHRPEHLAPFGITAGPDGALWFTNNGDSIGRITTAGAVTSYSSLERLEPRRHHVGSRWCPLLVFTNFGNHSHPSDASRRRARSPTSPTGVAGTAIIGGPDNVLWFTDSTDSLIGRITTGDNLNTYFQPDHPTAVRHRRRARQRALVRQLPKQLDRSGHRADDGIHGSRSADDRVRDCRQPIRPGDGRGPGEQRWSAHHAVHRIMRVFGRRRRGFDDCATDNFVCAIRPDERPHLSVHGHCNERGRHERAIRGLERVRAAGGPGSPDERRCHRGQRVGVGFVHGTCERRRLSDHQLWRHV